jgi:hypothetical protein
MICTFVVAYTPSIKDGGERLGLIIMLIIIQVWLLVAVGEVDVIDPFDRAPFLLARSTSA